MCGIVGVIGRAVNANHVQWLKDAIYVDTMRGEHSTGLARINSTDKETEVVKLAVPGYIFVDNRLVTNMLSRVGGCSGFFAHNRFATAGRINAANAHPFIFDDITLVHNGTLSGWQSLNKDVPWNTFDVDSEALTYSIADVGYRETFRKADGAYATVWYDGGTDSLYMLRNDERTLYYARDKKTKGIVYFASEAWMITTLCARKGLETEQPTLLPSMVLHKFDLSTQDSELLTEEVEGYKAPKFQQATGDSTKPRGNGKASTKKSNFARKQDFDKILSELDIQEGDIIPIWVGGWKQHSNDQMNGTALGWFMQEDTRKVIDARVYNMPGWFAKSIDVMNNDDPNTLANSGGDYVFCELLRVGHDSTSKEFFLGLKWLNPSCTAAQLARAKDKTFATKDSKAQ